MPANASLLDNNVIQGTGYIADAYARVVLDKNFTGAYDLALKGIAAFGAHAVVKQMAADLDNLKAKGQLPPGPASSHKA
jgi:hypothetical protein